MFKRGKIYPTSEDSIARMFSRCNECNSQMFGVIKKFPVDKSDVEIFFKLNKTNKCTRPHFNKRPLSGAKRHIVGNDLLASNIVPSEYRRRRAAKEMEFGQSEPTSLPKLRTLRVVKHEEQRRRRVNDDVVTAICIMKVDPNTNGCIRDIGIDPFFVHFWSNNQIHVYNWYCRGEYLTLKLDATESVVSTVLKPSGSKTGHIFLYEGTIRFTTMTKENQFSVCNMLSESHNAVAIYNWLAQWLRCGALKPREVVTDVSLTLMYASVLAFTDCKTLIQQYLQICYEGLFLTHKFEGTCYIRNDVAHIIKNVSSWTCFKKQHRLTKQFYLKGMGQLIQCQDIEDAENIFRAMFFVAHSDTEGTSVVTGKPNTCENLKYWLIQRAGTGTIEGQNNLPDHVVEDYSAENSEHAHKDYENLSQSPFENWVENIAGHCLSVVNTNEEQGSQGNQQCMPSFAKELIKFCKTLPLWSAIMTKFFTLSPKIGSSASVESSFNHIKHRIFEKLPVRADEFVHTLMSNFGATSIIKNQMSQVTAFKVVILTLN